MEGGGLLQPNCLKNRVNPSRVCRTRTDRKLPPSRPNSQRSTGWTQKLQVPFDHRAGLARAGTTTAAGSEEESLCLKTVLAHSRNPRLPGELGHLPTGAQGVTCGRLVCIRACTLQLAFRKELWQDIRKQTSAFHLDMEKTQKNDFLKKIKTRMKLKCEVARG